MKNLFTALSESVNTWLFAAVFALVVYHTPVIAAPADIISLLCDSGGTVTIDLAAKTFEVDLIPVLGPITIKDNVEKNDNLTTISSVKITPNTITASITLEMYQG